MNHILIQNQFFSEAKTLRNHFEDNFSVHKDTSSQRFVWDYWYVKNQYQFLRTPAWHYFPKKVYEQFHTQLVQWGREVLGCHDVSPPWLSYYVEGMEQKVHSDVPHGPWAWVYSLSPRKRKFSGGETFIYKPEVLNYWSNFLEETDREQNAYLDLISPDFNKLIVFDPRFPHGVTPLRGTSDPLEGRLVIHGWFVEPRPYVVGALTTNQVQSVLEPAIHGLSDFLAEAGDFHGTMSFRISISKSGRVEQFKWLTNTVMGLQSHEAQVTALNKWTRKQFSQLKFAARTGTSQITVPVLFRAD